MKNQNQKGFTLVELVIVIAVIAILAGVLIGTFATVISRANQNKAVQEAKAAVDEAYVEYVADYHKAPESIKVTKSSDGKFSKVVFGNKTDAGYVSLEEDGYVELNSVNNQVVYFNWNYETNGESTYSVGTGKTTNTELSVEPTIKAYVLAELAKVSGAEYYKVGTDSTTITFSVTQETGFVAVNTPATLTYDGVSYTITFTLNATEKVTVEEVTN